MKKFNLTTKINRKFGNVKNFSRLTGLAYMTIMNTIHNRNSGKRRDEHLELIHYFIDNLEVPKMDIDIDDHLRDQIRIAIVTKFGTFANFSQQHPDFGKSYLSQIKTGKKSKLNSKAIELCNILKVDI